MSDYGSFEWPPQGGSGSGTVTSVGLADGSTVPIYTITNSPVTTSGTLTFTFATQVKNLVLASPTTGANAQPSFRALVAADLPTGDLTDVGTDGITIGSGVGAVIGSGTTISQHVADTSHNGYLSSTDWNTFNGKQQTVSFGAFGSTPNSNGAVISSGVITLEPADATNPGGVSTASQTFAGDKSFTGVISAPSGTVSAVGLHFATDVGTGFYRTGVDQLNFAAAGAKVLDIGTSGLAVTGTLSASSTVQGTQLISTISTGTAPLTVSSTTQVANLNAATAGTATNATNVATITKSDNVSYFPVFVSANSSSNQAIDVGPMTYNPSTSTLTATTFAGNASTATTATNATNVATTQVSSNASYFPLMVASSTNGNQACDLGTGLTFNPSTNNLTTTTFTGDLIGNSPAVSAISSTAIDWSILKYTGGLYNKTLGAATTFTFTGATAGQTIIVALLNTGSNWSVTWPSVKWTAATAPTMSPGAVTDIYTFVFDGTSYYGSAVQNMS